MSGNITSRPNYIFYLKFQPELPENYFLISAHLSNLNIALVPVEIDDYIKLSRQEKVHTIVVVSDIAKQSLYKKLRENFLDFALKNGRTYLYEISSFGQIDIANNIRYQNNYTHIRLPERFDLISKIVARKFYQDKKSLSIWPGGRRAKLPSMI